MTYLTSINFYTNNGGGPVQKSEERESERESEMEGLTIDDLPI